MIDLNKLAEQAVTGAALGFTNEKIAQQLKCPVRLVKELLKSRGISRRQGRSRALRPTGTRTVTDTTGIWVVTFKRVDRSLINIEDADKFIVEHNLA